MTTLYYQLDDTVPQHKHEAYYTMIRGYCLFQSPPIIPPYKDENNLYILPNLHVQSHPLLMSLLEMDGVILQGDMIEETEAYPEDEQWESDLIHDPDYIPGGEELSTSDESSLSM